MPSSEEHLFLALSLWQQVSCYPPIQQIKTSGGHIKHCVAAIAMTISMKVFLRVSPFKPPNQCLQRMAVRNNTKRLILSIDNQIGQASHHTPGNLIGIFPSRRRCLCLAGKDALRRFGIIVHGLRIR